MAVSLLRSIAGAIKEFRTRTASILWDLSDQSMVDMDRDLRLEIIRNQATRLSPRLQEAVDRNPDYQALALCYRAASAPDNTDAIELSEAAISMATMAQVRAIAMALSAELRLRHAQDLRGRGQFDEAIRVDDSCRAICDIGIREYSEEKVFPALAFSLHSVLGSIDRWSKQPIGAQLHFAKAIEAFHKMPIKLQKVETQRLGMLYIDLGDSYRLVNNVEAAKREYSTSLALLDVSESKVAAMARLLTILLDSRADLKRAKRLAKKAMAMAKKLKFHNALVDELESELAWVTWELGDREAGLRLYQQLDREGVHEMTRRGARKFVQEQRKLRGS